MKNSKKTLKITDDILDNDLSSLLSDGGWQRFRFELKPKNKTVTLRLSEELLKKIKNRAQKSGLDYQKFIRLALEQFVGKGTYKKAA